MHIYYAEGEQSCIDAGSVIVLFGVPCICQVC